MKKNLLFCIALTVSAFTLFAQPIYNEAGIQLHHSPSQEEIEWVISKGLVSPPVAPTPPPVGQIRPIAEWEPAEAVLIRYPFGIPISLIKAMAEDIEVITIVANNSEKTTVLNQYTSNGVNIAHCQQFLIAPSDTYWTRDYGPWFMAIDNNEVAMFDFNYNRIKFGHGGSPRHLDNAVNQALADYLSSNGTQINRYDSQLYLTGGNFMNDGIRMAASTTLIPTENSEYTLPQLKQQFQQYLGLEAYHFIPDPIYSYDAIQHIDCWSKLLAPDKVMLARVPQGSQNYNKFEAAKDSMEAIISSYGTPMQVFRVDEVAINSYYTTPYTNSLILNNKVFVPVTGHSYDAAAIQAYKDAMPGYEIIGINYSSWVSTDALHCRTHEIADRCMLYIKHQPLCGEIENTGSLTFNAELYSYCSNPIISDSVIVYLRINGGEYQKYNMTFSGDNQWEVTVSGLPGGLVEYYVFAADESGRRESHPYIARYAPNADPHKFILTDDAPDLPVLVIDKTSSSVTSDGFEVIEDYITVSNAGTANLTFEITGIDFPEMLAVDPINSTVQPDGSQIITLSYNFAGVENGAYTGSLKIVSNDLSKPEITISLSAIQNVIDHIPVLSLNKTISSVYTEELTIIEDFITVSNIGNGDLTIEITDINFNKMLTVSPHLGTIIEGDSLSITLSYDFNNISKIEAYTGSFKLLSNDPLQPETEITLYAMLNLGINQDKPSLIYIYPNPANDRIMININDDNATQAYIYNILGKQLKEITLTKGLNTIEIQDLPNSVYFIKIKGYAYKFVKL